MAPLNTEGSYVFNKKDISKTRRMNTKRDTIKQYKEYQKEEYY